MTSHLGNNHAYILSGHLNSITKYLDDLCLYFEVSANQVYLPKLLLYKAIISDTEAPLLNLHLYLFLIVLFDPNIMYL